MLMKLNSICLQKDKQQTLKLSTAADEVGCAFLPGCSQHDKDSDFFSLAGKTMAMFDQLVI